MWLTVRTGKARGTSVCIDRERFVIGRDDDCDLVIQDDPKVSRAHVCLEDRPDGRLSLRDLGSSNGTFVNRERVERAVLEGQEQIQLGDTILASSAEEPRHPSGSTILGSSTVFGAAQRLMLQRSVRRATMLGAAALAAATTLGALFATNVLPPGDGEAEAVARVVRAAARSTVLVQAEGRQTEVETGSGWVLDGDRGLVVTNAHVVNGGRTFWVGVGDDVYGARIVGVAPCEDLAVLHVEGAPKLPTLPLGEQSSVAQGETVVALGYPANASQEASQTSTSGVVSIARSEYREAAPDLPRYSNVIQTDAAINPGNSGGPLLDLDGKLIGVNAAGRTVAADGRIIQGQSYAIGVDRVKEVTDVLRTGRSLGWTGLGFDFLSAEDFEKLHLPPGLLVTHALPGSGPEQRRLARARAVVIAVNGANVGNSLAGYCDAIGDATGKAGVKLTVLEPGAKRPRDVTLRLS